MKTYLVFLTLISSLPLYAEIKETIQTEDGILSVEYSGDDYNIRCTYSATLNECGLHTIHTVKIRVDNKELYEYETPHDGVPVRSIKPSSDIEITDVDYDSDGSPDKIDLFRHRAPESSLSEWHESLLLVQSFPKDRVGILRPEDEDIIKQLKKHG